MSQTQANKKLHIKLCFAAVIAAAFLLSLFFSCGFNNFTACAADGQAVGERVFDAAYDTAEGFAYGSGDGKKESAAFLIATPAHLDNIRKFTYYDVGNSEGDYFDRFGYYFKLTADINLTGSLLKSGAGWEPVNGFYGKFDGGGHTVSGLWINRPDDNFTGFFGRAYDAEITRLNIILDTEKGITGGSCTGGLIGDGGNSVIKQCSVAGNITAGGGTHEDYETGGIFGNLGESKVSECRFTGSVTFMPAAEETAFVCVGGIAGRVTNTEITNCLVRARICGGTVTFSAGLSGSYFSSRNTAAYCFIALSGDELIYPFFGTPILIWGTSASAINCYYYDTDAFARVFDNYPHETDGNSKRLTAQNSDKSEYAGFDFDSIWGFDQAGNLVLREFGGAYDTPAPPVPPDLTWLYITLSCLLFAAVVIIAAIMLYRRKKAVVVTQTEIINVIKEVPLLKTPLPVDLSRQERRVAELILKGKTCLEIGDELKVSDGTVKTYMVRLYVKTGVDNQKEFMIRYLGGG